MDLMLGILFRKQEIEEGVGRLNWATQAFPYETLPPTHVCLDDSHQILWQTIQTRQSHGNMYILFVNAETGGPP